VDSVTDWNGWMLVSIMQQHRLQTQFGRVYKQSPFFGSESIHQAIYIVAQNKVIFFSEERHQLLLKTAKRRNSEIFSRRFNCSSLDPSKSALLLDSSRLRTRSFSSSCVRMCGCGAEDLPWETCGSVDAGGSGEPEVDSSSSSSSESMVNSFGGSGTEIPSPWGTVRMVYSDTLLSTSFPSLCLQKQVAPYRSSSQLHDYLAPSKPQE
jgi:hypothetical protein